MKRLIVISTGLTALLLSGCCQKALAENSELISIDQIQPVDSVRADSLQERAKRNFAYIKAGPADPGKVTGELFAGGLGAIMGGVVFGRVGFGLASSGGGGCFGCYDVGGLIGGLVGYLVGSNVGCATGVCLVGNSGDERGSYWAGLGGSFLGTLVGGICAIGIFRDSDDDSGAAPLFLITAAQAGGATICFNATRKKKVEVPSAALLNLDGEKLSLTLPKINVSQDSFGSANLRLELFQADF
jgi:hypothetical protein